MTHEEFWDLYDNNQITVKVFDGELDGEHKSVEAFEYNGKFYLRIHTSYQYTTGRRAWGKRYRMSKNSDYIKEFDTKQHANNYFKKAFSGLPRVI